MGFVPSRHSIPFSTMPFFFLFYFLAFVCWCRIQPIMARYTTAKQTCQPFFFFFWFTSYSCWYFYNSIVYMYSLHTHTPFFAFLQDGKRRKRKANSTVPAGGSSSDGESWEWRLSNPSVALFGRRSHTPHTYCIIDLQKLPSPYGWSGWLWTFDECAVVNSHLFVALLPS